MSNRGRLEDPANFDVLDATGRFGVTGGSSSSDDDPPPGRKMKVYFFCKTTLVSSSSSRTSKSRHGIPPAQVLVLSRRLCLLDCLPLGPSHRLLLSPLVETFTHFPATRSQIIQQSRRAKMCRRHTRACFLRRVGRKNPLGTGQEEGGRRVVVSWVERPRLDCRQGQHARACGAVVARHTNVQVRGKHNKSAAKKLLPTTGEMVQNYGQCPDNNVSCWRPRPNAPRPCSNKANIGNMLHPRFIDSSRLLQKRLFHGLWWMRKSLGTIQPRYQFSLTFNLLPRLLRCLLR
jgi:hypothetical protein